MDQHEPDPEPVQQCDIVNEIREARIRDRLAAEDDHEGASAVGMDVGCGLAHPVDEGIAGWRGVVQVGVG